MAWLQKPIGEGCHEGGGQGGRWWRRGLNPPAKKGEHRKRVAEGRRQGGRAGLQGVLVLDGGFNIPLVGGTLASERHGDGWKG